MRHEDGHASLWRGLPPATRISWRFLKKRPCHCAQMKAPKGSSDFGSSPVRLVLASTLTNCCTAVRNEQRAGP